MKTERHIVVVKEEDWFDSKYRTVEWEKSVEIVRWEHDYEKKEYVISYKTNAPI